MRNRNLIIGFAMIGALLIWSPSAIGMTTVGSSGDKQISSEKKERAVQVSKATELMEKMENGILYTERNQYRLGAAKVIHLGKHNKQQAPVKGRKKMVELTFVDKVLTEVVIHR
jgi:hypothetical protein